MAQPIHTSEEAQWAVADKAMRRIDECEQAILATMDAHVRRAMIWISLLYLAMLGNIVKDFLR